MATVQLRAPLKELAGGEREVRAEGASVGEVLRELERLHPRIAGWVLDEHGRVRTHVNVFLDGERVREDAPVEPASTLQVLPSISGGSRLEERAPEGASVAPARRRNVVTELLVGTKKGLFVLEGDPSTGEPFEVKTRAFEGNVVEFATRDPRTGRYFASVTSGHFGPRILHSMDPTGEWEPTTGLGFPEGDDWTLERIWSIRPGEADGLLYAGVAPAALFTSTDDGMTWELNRGLFDQPTRSSWQPGAGGLCLHSIATWPGDPSRLAIGISAVGVWLSDDGGTSWRHGNEGLVPRYIPEDAREGTIDLCVHNMHRAPLRPERLFMQFHGGVYRSDDAGESWLPIADGLPADFGFPLTIDPADPDSAFVIPMVADLDRVTVDGKVRVFGTRDAGSTWTSLSEGLPQDQAYLTILRQAFDREGEGDGLGLYFGATSGDVFGSADGGRSWFNVHERLAPVNSVRAT